MPRTWCSNTSSQHTYIGVLEVITCRCPCDCRISPLSFDILLSLFMTIYIYACFYCLLSSWVSNGQHSNLSWLICCKYEKESERTRVLFSSHKFRDQSKQVMRTPSSHDCSQHHITVWYFERINLAIDSFLVEFNRFIYISTG